MRRAEKLYTTALFCEGVVLLVSCVLSLVWLWRVETEQRYTFLHGMLIGTLILSFVLIPIESALFSWYRRRSGEKAFRPSPQHLSCTSCPTPLPCCGSSTFSPR